MTLLWICPDCSRRIAARPTGFPVRCACGAIHRSPAAGQWIDADDLPEPVSPAGDRESPAPTHGPGTELAKILASLSLTENAGCRCKKLAKQMNAWGPGECRQQRAYIVSQLLDARDSTPLAARAWAAALSLTTSLGWRLDLLDPLGSLVDEAIRRAEFPGKC